MAVLVSVAMLFGGVEGAAGFDVGSSWELEERRIALACSGLAQLRRRVVQVANQSADNRAFASRVKAASD